MLFIRYVARDLLDGLDAQLHQVIPIAFVSSTLNLSPVCISASERHV